MGGTLDLYTDASVRGSFLVDPRHPSVSNQRSRRGPAMAAWIGWHDADPSTRPTVVGQAYVGEQGTQSAEYQAALHGLMAVYAYAASQVDPPGLVRLCTDNKTVAHQLRGEWAVGTMKRYYDAIQAITGALEVLSVQVAVEKVTEKDPYHKRAHTLSRLAWDQVLIDQTWRPT